jgi:hypothetical protein
MPGVLFAAALLLAAADPPPAPQVSEGAAAPKAAPSTVAPAVVQGKDKDDPNKLICHMETETGSRFQVKKCVTQGEAAMRKFEDRQDLERAQGATYRR